MPGSSAQARTGDLKGVPIPEIEALDLRSHSVLAHFARSTRNVQLLDFLLALDRIDKWAVDYNELESPKVLEIQLFVKELQRFVEASLPVLHRVPREFADILSHLTTTRCMYLIRFVGQHNDEFLEQLGFLLEEEAGQSPNVATIRRRLEAFSKAKLLGEIFSGKRLTRISQIMGSYSDV
jgi:hypothetical protein